MRKVSVVSVKHNTQTRQFSTALRRESVLSVRSNRRAGVEERKSQAAGGWKKKASKNAAEVAEDAERAERRVDWEAFAIRRSTPMPKLPRTPEQLAWEKRYFVDYTKYTKRAAYQRASRFKHKMQLAQKALDETPSYFVRDAKQQDWSLFPTYLWRPQYEVPEKFPRPLASYELEDLKMQLQGAEPPDRTPGSKGRKKKTKRKKEVEAEAAPTEGDETAETNEESNEKTADSAKKDAKDKDSGKKESKDKGAAKGKESKEKDSGKKEAKEEPKKKKGKDE